MPTQQCRPLSSRKRPALVLILLLLILGAAAWYARPMPLLSLAPEMEIQSVSCSLWYDPGIHSDLAARTLDLTAEDGDTFEQVRARLESLRFCRLPLGSLLQSLWDGQSHAIFPGDYDALYTLYQLDGDPHFLIFQHRLGWWSVVRDDVGGWRNQAVLLWGGQEESDALHQFLWEIAQPVES